MAEVRKSEIIRMIKEINNYGWLCMIYGFVSGFYEVLMEKKGGVE